MIFIVTSRGLFGVVYVMIGGRNQHQNLRFFFEASNTIQQSIVAGSSVFLHFKTIEWIILAVETIHFYYFGNSLYSTQQNPL